MISAAIAIPTKLFNPLSLRTRKVVFVLQVDMILRETLLSLRANFKSRCLSEKTVPKGASFRALAIDIESLCICRQARRHLEHHVTMKNHRPMVFRREDVHRIRPHSAT
jgi:hypothetical protein